MSDQWGHTTLGHVLTEVAERAAEQHIDLVLSVTEKRGIVPQEEVFSKRIATSDTSKYKVLHPLDIAYNPYLLWAGAVGQWLGDVPGVTSPVYECFRANHGVLPRFVGLVLESGVLTPYFDSTAIGSIQRRRRTTPQVFLNAPLRLPPLAVQQRIVNLIAHFDTLLENLASEAGAGDRLGPPLSHELLAESGALRPLGEVGEFVRGRRFTKEDYVPSGLGCIHYGQVHTSFGPVATECLTFLPEGARSRLRLANPGDVVVAGTSETVEGLGKATVWLGKDDVAVHDDCYIFRHTLDPKFASYAFTSPWFQRQKRQYAGGTKVTRISALDLAKIQIPIPPLRIQQRVGEALAALTIKGDAVRTEQSRLQRLRAGVLSQLLSGEVEIPQAYDALFEGVA
jgi:restriction endonuclease S subunit